MLRDVILQMVVAHPGITEHKLHNRIKRVLLEVSIDDVYTMVDSLIVEGHISGFRMPMNKLRKRHRVTHLRSKD